MQLTPSPLSPRHLALLAATLFAGTCLAQPAESPFIGPMPVSREPKPVAPQTPAPAAPKVLDAATTPLAAPTPATTPAPVPASVPAPGDAAAPTEIAKPSAPLAKPRIEALPLGKTEPTQTPVAAAKPASSLALGGTQTIIALSAVIALMFLGAGLFKKYAKNSGSLTAALGAGGKAPSGILQVLGRYPAGRGITLVLLRVDRRVLLVTQSKITGLGRMSGGLSMSVLSEITDPSDVASIVAKASAADGSSPSAHFNAALEEASATGDEPRERSPSRSARVDASALSELLPVAREVRPTVRAATPPAAQAVRTSTPANTAARKDAAVADLRQRLASMRANTATVQVKVGTRPGSTEVTA